MKVRQMEPARNYVRQKLKSPMLRLLFEEEKARSEIARLVLTAREKAGLTQRELAKRAKSTQAVIARLELGTDGRMPSLTLIARLLHAAGAKLELVCKYD